MELVFGTEATLDLFYSVIQGNSSICKNKDAPVWNLVSNSDGDFSGFFSPLHVGRRKCCQLGSTVASLSNLATTVVYSTFVVTQRATSESCFMRIDGLPTMSRVDQATAVRSASTQML